MRLLLYILNLWILGALDYHYLDTMVLLLYIDRARIEDRAIELGTSYIIDHRGSWFCVLNLPMLKYLGRYKKDK
jgi:hypothetical protein